MWYDSGMVSVKVCSYTLPSFRIKGGVNTMNTTVPFVTGYVNLMNSALKHGNTLTKSLTRSEFN